MREAEKRHIVDRLTQANATVIVGTRGEKMLRPWERRLALHQMLDKESWLDALAEVDILINAVGILRERGEETFEKVHHLAVQGMAKACEALQIKFIHISALGLHEGLKAPFCVTKKLGEQEIIHTQADWHIVRASLVEGEGAYGATWFKKLALWPVHVIPEKHALISPVNVQCLAAKVLELVSQETGRIVLYHRIHEISDGVDYLLADYFIALNEGRQRPQILIPDILVRLVTRICDQFNLTPLTYGHYELLTYDNCPNRGVV